MAIPYFSGEFFTLNAVALKFFVRHDFALQLLTHIDRTVIRSVQGSKGRAADVSGASERVAARRRQRSVGQLAWVAARQRRRYSF